MSAVYGVIRKLGATSKYKGYYYVVDAVEMAQKIYERPVKVTKDIYPVIARKYKSTPSNVEPVSYTHLTLPTKRIVTI